MMRLLVLLSLGILLLCTAAQADTTWVAAGSEVSGDWSAAASPYMMEGIIRIGPMDTLRIGPGVTVFFDGPFYLRVEGVLITSGREDSPVYFTTDTLFNPSGWSGIRFMHSTGTSKLDYAMIENGRSFGPAEFGYGGGVYLYNSQVEMNSCTVRACRANSGHGIALATGAHLTMSHCVIRENGALSGFGGGVYCRGSSLLTLNSCTLAHNAAQYGAAIALDASTAALDGCSLYKNNAVMMGGGVFCNASTLSVFHTTFLANTSVGGGAVDGRYEMYLTMDHCLIESNAANRQGIEGQGGGLLMGNGQQRITNTTFVNNAAGQGGAVYCGTATRLENCIVAFQARGGGVHCPYPATVLRFSCFSQNLGGNVTGTQIPQGLGVISNVNVNGDSCDQYMNLFRDPQFDDGSAVRYHLTEGSPCINAGNPASPRDPDSTLADIGAFYYDGVTAVAPSVTLQPSLFDLTAYPNPFNPSTSLAYTLPRGAQVSLKVYDLLGREVAALVNGPQLSGSYRVVWQATGEPSGTYIAVLNTEGQRITRTLMLLK